MDLPREIRPMDWIENELRKASGRVRSAIATLDALRGEEVTSPALQTARVRLEEADRMLTRHDTTADAA